MNEEQYFHFTLGPVQSFVAQARRTRDFWAGSFLLSFLSAVAIKAVKKQGGTLLFPQVDEDYLLWLEQKGAQQAPQQGCIPNRFKGGVAKVPEDFDPERIEKSVKQCWQGLAQAVWLHDLADCGAQSRKIWDRQISEFWEISWVLSESIEKNNLLDRRKNWRSYLPPEEPGVKCMMMDGWQELSGIKSPNAKGLKDFWETLRRQSRSLNNDLREGEYLCAIAFVKRRFAHVFADFRQELEGGWSVHGWKVNPSVPSVSYMAAVPWLASVIEHAPKKTLSQFCHSAGKLTDKYGHSTTPIKRINQAINNKGYSKQLWDFKSLDGDVFFEMSLDNKNRHADQKQAQQVKKDLKALIASVKAVSPAPASPFYAVLMMDGDSLGSQMSDRNKQQAISLSLNDFTRRVDGIVKDHSGFLIYAGGDDVLALLPLDAALQCAAALRQQYLDSFRQNGGYSVDDKPAGTVKSTLSGAIEYAHIKIPLGKVLADAHQLLDDVAKDQMGRDSIAVRVWKPGGQHLQWAMPWKKALQDNKVIIDELAQQFARIEQQTPFSSSFFFNIEARFDLLQNQNADGEKVLSPDFDMETIVALIASEYLNSGVNQNRTPKLRLQEAQQLITPLIEQCLPVKRTFENETEYFTAAQHLNIDAAHLIRFLADKGIEHGQ